MCISDEPSFCTRVEPCGSLSPYQTAAIMISYLKPCHLQKLLAAFAANEDDAGKPCVQAIPPCSLPPLPAQ
jgi:hypothetical protein